MVCEPVSPLFRHNCLKSCESTISRGSPWCGKRLSNRRLPFFLFDHIVYLYESAIATIRARAYLNYYHSAPQQFTAMILPLCEDGTAVANSNYVIFTPGCCGKRPSSPLFFGVCPPVFEGNTGGAFLCNFFLPSQFELSPERPGALYSII